MEGLSGLFMLDDFNKFILLYNEKKYKKFIYDKNVFLFYSMD